MRKYLAVGFIGLYLSALSFGLLSHMLGAWTGSHFGMYYIVWDMFCGWSAYDIRLHVIAQGESQNFYRLTPAPWGEFHPYGFIGREHYDSFASHGSRLGLNVLKHTEHEPILRVFVVEECWPKKLNLPDAVWNSRYEEPKDPLSYYRIRQIVLPDGQVTANYNSWIAYQSNLMFADNPRLQADSQTNRPMFMADPSGSGRGGGGMAYSETQVLRNPGSNIPSAN